MSNLISGAYTYRKELKVKCLHRTTYRVVGSQRLVYAPEPP